ncbi:MAG TPA: ABC transporter substrate-binding protein [Gemmatimonadales bacterium]|nr:ABC transporter substrate-binding protein [Gemmatimonadales bacterium]
MTSRRTLIAAIAASLLGRPMNAGALQAGRIYRLGILGNVPRSDSQGAKLWGALTQGLRDLGYVEGQNLIVDHRSTEGRSERLPILAGELVRLKPDVIVVPNQANAVAVRRATHTIPIVAANFDPLGSGLAASFARPGGNVTGLSLIAPEIVGKQLQVLKEIVPRLTRVAILWSPANRSSLLLLEEAQMAAGALGLVRQ